MNLSVCQNILQYVLEILIVVTVIVAKCRILGESQPATALLLQNAKAEYSQWAGPCLLK